MALRLEGKMADRQTSQTAVADPGADTNGATKVTREQLIELLNEDLAREYQSIIAYVVYSQVLKGPQYMNIAKELEKHAAEELNHALIVERAPTTFGEVSFRVESRLGQGEVVVTVESPPRPPRRLLVRPPLPPGWRVAGARVGGAAP